MLFFVPVLCMSGAVAYTPLSRYLLAADFRQASRRRFMARQSTLRECDSEGQGGAGLPRQALRGTGLVQGLRRPRGAQGEASSGNHGSGFLLN